MTTHISVSQPLGMSMRWVAQVWSLLSLLFLLLIFLGEAMVAEPAPAITTRDLIGLAFFPIGVLAGLILAWWREGLGGGLAVASLAAVYLALKFLDGRWPRGPFFALVAAPGLLFLFCWILTRSQAR